MDTDELFAFAHDLAACAAKETLSRFRKGVTVTNKERSGFDPVTEADREAETALRKLISERFPHHGIRGEEFPETLGSSSWRWILDPVDGTRAFICGVPVWTTLIALERDGVPLFGIVDQPFLKERWTASLAPAFEGRIAAEGIEGTKTSGCRKLSEARLMVTDMRAGEYLSEAEAETVDALSRQVRLARQGLDSYGFGLVASGQFDLVVEAALQWHDIAAVIPVITAAGGVVCDWNGRPLTAREGTYQVIAAASPSLAGEAAEALAD